MMVNDDGKYWLMMVMSRFIKVMVAGEWAGPFCHFDLTERNSKVVGFSRPLCGKIWVISSKVDGYTGGLPIPGLSR